MKIVSKEDFLKLPAGTLFAPYRPCIFGDIAIKGDTLGLSCNDDFLEQPLLQLDSEGSCEDVTILDSAAERGTSFALDLSCEQREGLFDSTSLYAIWEKGDLLQLIYRLNECLHGASQ